MLGQPVLQPYLHCMTTTAAMPLTRTVGPDFGAIGGAGELRLIVGALLTYGLIVAVLMLVISASTWAIASSSGSWHTAQKAKLGCFVAIGGAALTGAALTWANWLLDIGPHL
tara:strand:+ start:3886 stop:4221 length:336 start_codon:yes stop_codon:yes gene_type:complete